MSSYDPFRHSTKSHAQIGDRAGDSIKIGPSDVPPNCVTTELCFFPFFVFSVFLWNPPIEPADQTRRTISSVFLLSFVRLVFGHTIPDSDPKFKIQMSNLSQQRPFGPLK